MFGFSTLAVIGALTGAFASPIETETRQLTDIVFRRSNSTDLSRRQTTNFNQDFTTGGDVIFTPNGNTFEVRLISL
jgi:endo-1,4-beta-xylanase